MKTALLIGGSRGIGLGLVGELLARGWDVTATVRSPSADLESLRDRHGDRLKIESLDINQPEAVAAFADGMRGKSFDLLFMNAGILTGRGKILAEIPDADITDIFFTNAISPIRLADGLVGNVAEGGMIAFMSSILGSVGANDDGRAELYRASKAALNSLVRSFRARNASRDVTVLALHPGVVRTAMGGPTAPLDIETSVRGLADVIDQRWGTGGQTFVDYRNETIPW